MTKLATKYENVILIGDFNLTTENKNLETFMATFDLKCLINEPTCFQSANGKCIDLILTNRKNLFKKSNVIEVGISDHHSFIMTPIHDKIIKKGYNA